MIRLHTNDIPTPEKGFIVVDSSFLVAMQYEQVKTLPEPDEFADNLGVAMLNYLGRHGFAIVIPAMVAYEVTRLINESTNISDHFYDNRKD